MRPSTPSALTLGVVVAVLACIGAAVAAPGRPTAQNGSIVLKRLDPVMGKNRLYVVRPGGAGLRPLTRPAFDEDNDTAPDWAPGAAGSPSPARSASPRPAM